MRQTHKGLIQQDCLKGHVIIIIAIAISFSTSFKEFQLNSWVNQSSIFSHSAASFPIEHLGNYRSQLAFEEAAFRNSSLLDIQGSRDFEILNINSTLLNCKHSASVTCSLTSNFLVFLGIQKQYFCITRRNAVLYLL